MEIEDFIIYQMGQNRNYANSFQEFPLTNSNEQIHPKTGKIITFMESYSLIQKDAKIRAKRIIKKINQFQK